MSSRSYCFTLNNPTIAETEIIEDSGCRYLIYGIEIGENQGTLHYQGYLEMTSPQRISYLKKWLPRAHFEPRKGTREQAREYCMKDGEWIECGSWEAGGQGARNDLEVLMNRVKKNEPMINIMESDPQSVSRNLRFIEKYRELTEKEQTREFRKVEVDIYVGDAGTGKTRKAFEENPGLFTVNPDESFPFDGYDGESTILIDDFYGDLKYHHLLRILDGHQLRVNVKGSHRYARWTKVIITSNKNPEEWYKVGLTQALKRRINTVTEFCNDEAGNTMPPQLDQLDI